MLLSREIPDPRDIMIIGLADACGLWRGLIDEPTRLRPEPRIKPRARMDHVGQAVAGPVSRAGAGGFARTSLERSVRNGA